MRLAWPCNPGRLLAFLMFLGCAGNSGSGQSTPAPAPAPVAPKVNWQFGPMKAKLGDAATIDVPKGFEFTDGDGARKLMEAFQNPTDGDEVGAIAPVGTDDADEWVVMFKFQETGYVKDTDKDSLDANKILESIKQGTEEANKERAGKGWTAVHVAGWYKPPFYDRRTNNLTWAILGQEDGNKPEGQSVNYSVRMLGRRGIMKVELIASPDQMAGALPRFDGLVNGFSYSAGSKYGEFVKGDKVAEYGLTALIAGGVGAAVVKTGLLAKLLAGLAALWKVIAVALAGVATRFKRLLAWLRAKFGGEEKPASGLSSDAPPRELGRGDDDHT